MIRNKWSFIVEELSEYVVFDLETTGLSPEYDEIIEFSACLVINNEIVSRYETLIKPEYGISPFIEELTGIRNDMLEDKPKIDEVLPSIYDFLKDKVLLGHNVHFDLNFLYDAFNKYLNLELNNDYVDLLRLTRKVYPEYKTHRLEFLSKELKTTNKPTHRALNDALTTYEIYELCKRFTKEKSITFSDLFQTSYLTVNDIKSTVNAEEDHILNGEIFVFTGTLEKMDRKSAWELVVKNGGDIADGVSKKVNYLVLGNGDYHQRLKGGKSNKMKKAEDLILKGNDLQIISENVFYDMIYLYDNK